MNASLSVDSPPTFPARPTNGGPFADPHGLAIKAGTKIGDWIAEPKYNGWRALVHVPTGQMWNRHGKRLSINSEFKNALDKLAEIHTQGWPLEWLDVEALERRHGIGKGCLIVLDLIDLAAKPYETRRELLQNLFLELDLTTAEKCQSGSDFPILSIPPAVHASLEVWRDLQAINSRLGVPFYEGIVMKKLDAPYPLQRRSENEQTRTWVKHRWDF